ncbi:MAG: DUF2332 domain-containing protein [Desulfobulbaceae bacterium]|nr:DUF2332 domain-containing protein [Desulfobulbaceae bacterium]
MPASLDDFQIRLARRFRKQQEFAAGYSPLYSRLFGLLADWLAAEPGRDRLVDWLLQAGAARSSFDVPLLLLAGLHRDILNEVAEVAGLAEYYPTVGGTQATDDPNLAADLRAAMLARQTSLAAFIGSASVQTNETGRGLCWLLPVLYPGWKSIHLVDLGASAGLNLVAEQRHYQLISTEAGRGLLVLGSGEAPQFVVASQGDVPLPPERHLLPTIASRIGCDFAPFPLTTDVDEQTLAAFVWGDQVERLARLRQGIIALHRTQTTEAPVQLYPAHLPDALPRFLEEQLTVGNEAPLVFYNTYLTTYLQDKGASLRPQLAAWALKQSQPVLWLQWEPSWQGMKPPNFGWLAWTADLWLDGRHRQWHLAWAQPHGTHIQWLQAMQDWGKFWRERST